MGALRNYFGTRVWLVAAIVAAALCLRVLLPQGHMPVFEQKQIEVLVCHGAGTAPATVQVELPRESKPDKAAERCAFADLSVPMLGMADPLQLALALAFVLALWLTFSSPIPLRTPARLRPPLRGPPAAA